MDTQKRKHDVYIFGVNGYIGRHLALYAQRHDCRVLGLDISDTCPLEIDYLKFDVTQRDVFDHLDFDVDQVFFLAGLTGTEDGFSSYESYTIINQLGLNHLLDRMAQLNARARVIFLSTRLVYRGQDATPLTEEAEKAPLTPYALNKLAAEHLLKIYANRYGIPHTVFRIGVSYGNSFDMPYSYGTIGFFLSMARQGQNLTLYGDGSLKRSFTHVEDICRVICHASKRLETENQVLNIGGETLSLLEAARQIAETFNVGVVFVPFPEAAAKNESGDTILDDQKLRSAIPHPYEHRFRDWLTHMI